LFNPRYDFWGLKHKASGRGKIFGEGSAAAPAARVVYARKRARAVTERRRRFEAATVSNRMFLKHRIMAGDIEAVCGTVNARA